MWQRTRLSVQESPLTSVISSYVQKARTIEWARGVLKQYVIIPVVGIRVHSYGVNGSTFTAKYGWLV